MSDYNKSEYAWNSNVFSKDADNRDHIKTWIFVATLLSLLIHIALFIFLKKVNVDNWGKILTPDTAEFVIKSVHYDPNEIDLENLDKQDKIADSSPRDEKLPDQLDFYELQKQMPETDIKLTSSVEKIENLLVASKADLDEHTSFDFDQLKKTSLDIEKSISKDLKTSKQELLQDKNLIGREVPRLEIGKGNDNFDTKDFLKKISSSKEQLGKNVAIMQGFSDIDELLANGGKMTDATKPILMPADLLFEYDSHELRELSRHSLMKLGFLIQKNPKASFIFEGHADTFGDEVYNFKLSKLRAVAVKNWLQESLLIDGSRIKVNAFGKSRPLVTGGSIKDQAINRRVEIAIKYPK